MGRDTAILLGGGTPLFGRLEENMAFEHVGTDVHIDAIVKSHDRIRVRIASGQLLVRVSPELALQGGVASQLAELSER